MSNNLKNKLTLRTAVYPSCDCAASRVANVGEENDVCTTTKLSNFIFLITSYFMIGYYCFCFSHSRDSLLTPASIESMLCVRHGPTPVAVLQGGDVLLRSEAILIPALLSSSLVPGVLAWTLLLPSHALGTLTVNLVELHCADH